MPFIFVLLQIGVGFAAAIFAFLGYWYSRPYLDVRLHITNTAYGLRGNPNTLRIYLRPELYARNASYAIHKVECDKYGLSGNVVESVRLDHSQGPLTGPQTVPDTIREGEIWGNQIHWDFEKQPNSARLIVEYSDHDGEKTERTDQVDLGRVWRKNVPDERSS